jgi:hypothetical protein
MQIADKQELLRLRGPEPLRQNLTIPGQDFSVAIHGIVRSIERSAVYHEIEEMAILRDVSVEGERIVVTEDDIVAACWASACVAQPKLTSMEWLMVGARNVDLLSLIGRRCLVCSRLMSDETTDDGVSAAEAEQTEFRDPLASLPSGSV